MWDSIIINPMINALLFIYDFLGNNFGLAIIVFTAIVRLITLPLTYRQQVSTQKMQELQNSKQWKKIQEKYKDDKQKQQQEMMKLYQEMGINPLSGCLPLLIQFPIIIGLYQSIIRTLAAGPLQLVDLAKHIYAFTPKALIPLNSHFLWMNLGEPERLFLPFLPQFGIPVLTILVVVTTFFQTKMSTPPSPDSQSSQMNRMMSLYMPLLLGYFAYSFSAGLALYFVTSNILAIVQYAAMGRVDWKGLLSFGRGTSAGK